MVRLLPAFAPLVLMRLHERVEFDVKEEKKEKERRDKEEREKPASNQIITVASSSEQLPKRNRTQTLLPKGVKLAPLYTFAPLCQLMSLAITMKLGEEEGSLMWRMGSVLLDIASLGFAVMTGLFVVPSMVILVTIPRAKDGDNVM